MKCLIVPSHSLGNDNLRGVSLKENSLGIKFRGEKRRLEDFKSGTKLKDKKKFLKPILSY